MQLAPALLHPNTGVVIVAEVGNWVKVAWSGGPPLRQTPMSHAKVTHSYEGRDGSTTGADAGQLGVTGRWKRRKSLKESERREGDGAVQEKTEETPKIAQRNLSRARALYAPYIIHTHSQPYMSSPPQNKPAQISPTYPRPLCPCPRHVFQTRPSLTRFVAPVCVYSTYVHASDSSLTSSCMMQLEPTKALSVSYHARMTSFSNSPTT